MGTKHHLLSVFHFGAFKVKRGPSLAVQWLRFHLPMAGLAGSIPGQGAKLSHASKSKKPKHEPEIATKSVKIFKMVHIKKSFKN